jgi:mRNA interferase MazF
MNRGEVRWYNFQPPDKRRPIVILTRDSAIDVLTGIVVAPITSTIRAIPTEVLLLPETDGAYTESVVNLDNIYTVPKSKIGGLITILSPKKMAAVEKALCFALGINS